MKRRIGSALVALGLTGGVLVPELAIAQDTTTSRSTQTRPSQKDTRLRFGQIATRAVANFHAADSIERRLNSDGASLHPQLIALKMRIQSSLEESRTAMDNGDFDAANEALDRAQGFLDRFAKRLGGD